jgi:heme/copper-type cytochrome/quinol oxidase subunit 1
VTQQGASNGWWGYTPMSTAGFSLWFPKATGIMLSERLGKAHFVLMVIGTNVTFVPFFILGYDGMPRWMATYPAGAGFTTLSLISSIGVGVIGVAMCVFAWNVYTSARRKVPAGPDPWGAQTLEWLTSSRMAGPGLRRLDRPCSRRRRCWSRSCWRSPRAGEGQV